MIILPLKPEKIEKLLREEERTVDLEPDEIEVFKPGVPLHSQLDRTIEEIKQGRIISAKHREEASRISSISTAISEVVDRLFSRTLWHPTSRMRLIQFLFHTLLIKVIVLRGNPVNVQISWLSLTLRESSDICSLLIRFAKLQQWTIFHAFPFDGFRFTQSEREP